MSSPGARRRRSANRRRFRDSRSPSGQRPRDRMLSPILPVRRKVPAHPPLEAVRTAMPDEFYRIKRLPPYVFAEVNSLKAQARAAGRDVIDLGMGNPDGPT